MHRQEIDDGTPYHFSYIDLAGLVVVEGRLLVSLHNGTLLTLDWDTGKTLSVDPAFFGSAMGYMGRSSATSSSPAKHLVVMQSSNPSYDTSATLPVLAYNAAR